MERDRFVVGRPMGRWQTNCYLVGDRAQGTCVVIDPGEGAAEFVPQALDELGVTCESILLTHGHIDHFWSAPALGEQLDVEVFLHQADGFLWENPMGGWGAGIEQMEAAFGLRWDTTRTRLQQLSGDTSMRFSGLTFDVRHNPGHTPGHVTYLVDGLADAEVGFALGQPQQADAILFSGDLIFAGAMGRTDLAGGNEDDMWRSLVHTVLPLEDDVVILSGHGGDTTVGRERAANQFLHHAAKLLDVPLAGPEHPPGA